MTSEAPILVAVDFSRDSARAVSWAAHQAELEDAPLTLLHVIHDHPDSPGFYTEPGSGASRPIEERAKDMLDEFVDRIRKSQKSSARLANADVRIVAGLPAGRIVEFASKINARLIVVGSRGLTRLDTILLGSVAERVVKLAQVPVVVVKATAPEADA